MSAARTRQVNVRDKRADAARNIERILQSATTVLSARPRASMADIARNAGLGRVTIYSHFGSRAELVDAVTARIVTDGDRALDGVDLEGDPRQALERLIRSSWQLVDRSRSILAAAQDELSTARIRELHDGPAARVRRPHPTRPRCRRIPHRPARDLAGGHAPADPPRCRERDRRRTPGPRRRTGPDRRNHHVRIHRPGLSRPCPLLGLRRPYPRGVRRDLPGPRHSLGPSWVLVCGDARRLWGCTPSLPGAPPHPQHQPHSNAGVDHSGERPKTPTGSRTRTGARRKNAHVHPRGLVPGDPSDPIPVSGRSQA